MQKWTQKNYKKVLENQTFLLRSENSADKLALQWVEKWMFNFLWEWKVIILFESSKAKNYAVVNRQILCTILMLSQIKFSLSLLSFVGILLKLPHPGKKLFYIV